MVVYFLTFNMDCIEIIAQIVVLYAVIVRQLQNIMILNALLAIWQPKKLLTFSWP
jgi:hypothetical protein